MLNNREANLNGNSTAAAGTRDSGRTENELRVQCETSLENAHSPVVTAVVLHYGDQSTTMDCVNSLLESSWPELRIVVVDNGGNEILERWVRKKGDKCTYLSNASNLGYAEGNNRGIASAISNGADFVFILNNDTLIHSQAIERLVKASTRTPGKLGALYPRVHNTSYPMRAASIGGGIRWDGTAVHILERSDQRIAPNGIFGPIDWIPGAAVFMTKEALRDVGGFNSGYFVFHEDVEWSLRCRHHGYSLYCCLDADVDHISEKCVARSSRPFRTYYTVRNHIATARMWYPIWMTVLVLIRRIALEFPIYSFYYTVRRRGDLARAWFEALIDGVYLRLGWKYTS